MPLPSVDCRGSQDQPDKHPLGASTHSRLINLNTCTVDLKRVWVYHSHFANFVKLKNNFSLSCKGFEFRKIIFYFLCKCVIRVVIYLTAFNFFPAYLNSSPLHEEVHIFKHIILLFSKEIRLLFVSAQWKSSDVFVADRLRVLSNFQIIMKFYSFDDNLHCFSRSLLWSNWLGSSLIIFFEITR